MKIVNIALDEQKLSKCVASCNIRMLSKIWQDMHNLIYWWMGYPTLDRIMDIASKHPYLKEYIDFDIIFKRVEGVVFDTDNKKLTFGVQLEEYVPEIIVVRDAFREAFIHIPNGIEKTEAWLYPIALDAGADADIEALIYFACKGELLVDSDVVKEKWFNAICIEIEHDSLYNKDDTIIIERAKKKLIPLSEAAELRSFTGGLPYFFSYRDEEEDFIDASFFRGVEWLGIKGFEPWVQSLSENITVAYQGGVDPIQSAWSFFYICRSDLLLRKTKRIGLEAYLYGLTVGTIESDKPWRTHWVNETKDSKDLVVIDYLPNASIIVFAWERIQPSGINQKVYDDAILLLYQTQLLSGAWPLKSNDTEGCIFSTCFAIYALTIAKPDGWSSAVRKARGWLLTQQNELGCWYVEGGPAVMINTLCLEAIRLSEGRNDVSFRISDVNGTQRTRMQASSNLHSNKTIIFCEGDPGGKRNRNFDEECYKRIFSQEFPNFVFCSFGSCNDIETDKSDIIGIISKINPYHKILRLVDRDDRSKEEIDELNSKGIRVLSLRHLEAYLLDDEIIAKLCILSNKDEKLSEALALKNEAVNRSVQRGNPIDDIKSASGEIFTAIRRLLCLSKCGNDTFSFLRDTMTPLVTPETNTYCLLKKDIFGD